MNATRTSDVIAPEIAGTLAGLFRERVRRSPDAVAYRCHGPMPAGWHGLTWETIGRWVAHWQSVLAEQGLSPGERVAVMVRNSPAWAIFDQAALGLGLVVVPLHVEDSPENLAHILADSDARAVFLDGPDQWGRLERILGRLPGLQRIYSLQPVHDARVVRLELPENPAPAPLQSLDGKPDELATIIYTSGTTGRRPKGVMLSHRNILWNAHSGLQSVDIYREDLFLSFLPLAHAFERTVGYYLPMMAGATVAYARSIPQLAEDLTALRPTVIISVPRIYERVHNRLQQQLEEKSPLARGLFRLAVETGWDRFQYRQGRRPMPPITAPLWPLLERAVARKFLDKLGGRIRVAICGGAPLSFPVARTFLGLGFPILQGYGMTETSPVLSVNTLERNEPQSVGPPLRDVQLRLDGEGQLLAKGPGLMLGYWKQPEATAQIFDGEGWLRTGDLARLSQGAVHITGRLKEILVLSSGKKVPPEDLEMAIRADALFDQVMIIGDDRPCLAALVVLNGERLESFIRSRRLPQSPSEQQLHRALLDRIGELLAGFPGHAKVWHVAVAPKPWTVENGCMTPTLKLRRREILARYQSLVDSLYERSRMHQPRVGAGMPASRAPETN